MGFAPPFYRESHTDMKVTSTCVELGKIPFTLNILFCHHGTIKLWESLTPSIFQRSASCDRFLVEGSEREIKCVWSLREWVPRRRSIEAAIFRGFRENLGHHDVRRCCVILVCVSFQSPEQTDWQLWWIYRHNNYTVHFCTRAMFVKLGAGQGRKFSKLVWGEALRGMCVPLLGSLRGMCPLLPRC